MGTMQMLIPNRFIFVWTGRKFPYFCRVAIESALLADPDAVVEIHLFGEKPTDAFHFRHVAGYERVEIHDVDFAEVFDGLDRPVTDYVELLARIPPTAYSARSNLVRYGVLHARGGIYVDFDVVLIRDLGHLRRHPAFIGTELVWRADEARVEGRLEAWMLAPALAYVWTYALRRADTRLLGGRGLLEPLAAPLDPIWSARNLNNAVIGARPGSGFIRRVLARAHEADPRVRYALGPTLVSRAVRADDTDVVVLPPDVFYMQPPSYSFRYFEGRPVDVPDRAVLIHYVSSNHGDRLAALDERELRRRRGGPLFYRLGAEVADRARGLARFQ
jgi:hypothetical protein